MTDRTTLLALAERCEQAAGPDRELDAEIAVGLFGGEIIWKTANYTMDQYPVRRFQNSDYIGGYQNSGILAYTESLDAAVTLVPEGCGWMVMNNAAKVGRWPSRGASPALSICAAALRARAAAHD
jgi:hypothetical protein